MSRIGNYVNKDWQEFISKSGCLKMIVDDKGQTIIYNYGTPNEQTSFISHQVLNISHEQTITTIRDTNNILQQVKE